MPDATGASAGEQPMPPAERILLVSNRLPVTASIKGKQITVKPSSGGLATGLRGAHKRYGGVWIGWPGELPYLDARRKDELDARLAELDTIPVHLTRQEVKGFYEDISNGLLWPLLHYMLDRVPQQTHGWEIFRHVNQRFADVVVEQYRPGDTIWVHDYQLMLVPAMLRKRIPDARIGFFLHVPFPSSEVFGVLAQREELLHGLMGADLIGFHTASYLRHFSTSIRRVLGLDTQIDRVMYDNRSVRLGVFPMGIDAESWSARASEPGVLEEVARIRADAAGKKILLSIDRLDYTKGVLRRLLAFERLLKSNPSLRESVRLIQLTVPSREKIESYAGFRRRIDELVGRINSAYATTSHVPIHNLHRSLSEEEVTALYRAADVMLVTPLRDGMNLVAKEFVASRIDDDGVLVLSEFAGAAAELGEAVLINPYDVEGTAVRIRQALEMPDGERRARMQAMRQRVHEHDIKAWVRSFLLTLEASSGEERGITTQPSSPSKISTLIAAAREARQLVLALDYDGTLVPYAPTPPEAAPDPELLALLRALAERDRMRVHVITGRTRTSIEEWLGGLPIGLHAEHGLWSRMRPGEPWLALRAVSQEWKDKVRPILEHFVATTHGSFIEEKTSSIAWHYRLVSADFMGVGDYGEYKARELRLLLGELLGNAPVEVLVGSKVVEVRPQGVHKGAVVPLLLKDTANATVLAIGDDRTDEDLFHALPEGSLSVHVGSRASSAQYRVAGPAQARRLLEALLETDAHPRVPEMLASR